ncbi:hypothetical protein EDB89DRAFT_2068172 [Lactarius sanguifluus]|nr:hypothetical protein EDB89DRAFT_2068172 [Lactarius sanguifluus]
MDGSKTGMNSNNIEETRSLHRRQRNDNLNTTHPTLHLPSIRIGSRGLAVVGVRLEGEGDSQPAYTPVCGIEPGAFEEVSDEKIRTSKRMHQPPGK